MSCVSMIEIFPIHFQYLIFVVFVRTCKPMNESYDAMVNESQELYGCYESVKPQKDKAEKVVSFHD